MRDFRVSRERVSIAVTKLRSNRRQTRPLTNLHATINNVKANSRIERRSRTPSAHIIRRYQKERVFSLSSPRRSDECARMRCDLEREREGGFLRTRLRTYLPRTRFPATRGRKLRESLHLGRRFPLQKAGRGRVLRQEVAFLAQERLVASSPPFPFPVQSSRIVNILQIVLYLTTILTTINRQQKSILPQRTCKKCATQPASTSGDPSDAFASSSFDFKKPISCASLLERRDGRLASRPPSRRQPEVELAG